jgi:hypothetical protein
MTHLLPLETAAWAASTWTTARLDRGTSGDPLRLACDCFVDQGRHQTKSVLTEAAWTMKMVILLLVLLRGAMTRTAAAVDYSSYLPMMWSGQVVVLDVLMLLRC